MAISKLPMAASERVGVLWVPEFSKLPVAVSDAILAVLSLEKTDKKNSLGLTPLLPCNPAPKRFPQGGGGYGGFCSEPTPADKGGVPYPLDFRPNKKRGIVGG